MFRDRKDAGQKLGYALEKYRNKNVLVLGIPRGGVETAYYVAKHLNADLSLVVTRKLGFPYNPEAAFGAVAEDGSLYVSPLARPELSGEEINAVLESQKEEIRRRVQKLRKGKHLPDLKDRTVIIVDDGIATGATLFATIELCRKREAGKIVVAAPIAGKRMEDILRKTVDDFVILEIPPFYSAVSQGYDDFSNLSDDEALAFMEKWEKEHTLHQTDKTEVRPS
jgi:predicted phosphoribosyltransferase